MIFIKHIFILFILIMMLMSQLAFAQMSVIALKNGSVLCGYIALQRPGRDIVFHSDDAEMYVESSRIEIHGKSLIPYSMLSEGWKRLGNDEDSFVKDEGDNSLWLSSVEFQGRKHEQVRILEKGNVVKFKQLAEDDYIITWDEIRYISKVVDEEVDLKDELTLKSGDVYVGYIVEQRPGVLTKIREKNGDIISIDQSDIVASRKVSSKSDYEIWNSRGYTNSIVLKDGTEKEGLIVYQHVGNSTEQNYLELIGNGGVRERINYVDIEEYRCQIGTSLIEFDKN